MSKLTKVFHDKVVYSRRMTRLKELIIPLLDNSKVIMDLGCGDGKIDSYILEERKDLSIQGIDVLVRPETFIPVKEYDGKTIPYESGCFDTVIAIDVLHHTDDPLSIMKEMTRVTSKYILIKDHVRWGYLSYLKLRAMDYIGNAHYHVQLPYNYQKEEQWNYMYNVCGLHVLKKQVHLNLYTGILHLLFDRELHFIALLEKE